MGNWERGFGKAELEDTYFYEKLVIRSSYSITHSGKFEIILLMATLQKFSGFGSGIRFPYSKVSVPRFPSSLLHHSMFYTPFVKTVKRENSKASYYVYSWTCTRIANEHQWEPSNLIPRSRFLRSLFSPLMISEHEPRIEKSSFKALNLKAVVLESFW